MQGSSIQSPPASAAPDWKYDVFVSFRGQDTRRGFLSHLFRAFDVAGITCYRDNHGGQRGLTIGSMLLDAIRSSRIALVLFSTHYADSSWCLDELVEIMKSAEAYRDHGHMVVPIFYDVEPSHVRRQEDEFGEGFKSSLAEVKKEKEVKAAEWRAALEGAGKRSGWHLPNDANGDESEFIQKIVGQISSLTTSRNSANFMNKAVGIDNVAEDVISILDITTDGVRTIGLFGIKGIGTTTLAKLVHSHVFSKFEGASFLENIGDAKQEYSMIDFQKTLVSDILHEKQLTLDENDSYKNMLLIKDVFRHKKLLLVLDNVRDESQVALLCGRKRSLGNGSRILITTEDGQLFDRVIVDSKYFVSGLSLKGSLQLFTLYAFGGDDPEEGYEELSKNLVHYAGGLPSVVKTLGTCLYGKAKVEWYKLLDKLVQNPNPEWIEACSKNLDSILHPQDYKIGPYGGQGGGLYDDKSFTGVRQMRIVVVGTRIESISVDYDQNGSLVHSGRHGGPRQGTTHLVMFDYPHEFPTSVSGYITKNPTLRIIQSLSIQSNRRTYGPYGEESGVYFSFPEAQTEGRKILGFFGNCGLSLDSIGAYYGPISRPYPFETLGPFGHKEGRSWDDGKHSDVRQINVAFSSVIESISFIYDNYGHPTVPFEHGEQHSGEIQSVMLDYPYEYLTSISGYLGDDHGKLTLQSLSFHSNTNLYGPFGEETGIPFSGPSTGAKVVGFYGSCNPCLMSIGAYLEPVSHIHPLISIGPFGGNGGCPWDDGKHTDLRKIIIKCGSSINSIGCIYDDDGSCVEKPGHGGDGGANLYTVELDYPEEYITSMSGYYGRQGGLTVIKSLTFQSSRRVYGPYGKEEGKNFQCWPRIGKLVGLYGKSGTYLDSIGAYFAPAFHKDPITTAGPYGIDSGKQWDDGTHTNIRSIFISYGVVIDGIRCYYDDSGKPESAEEHGGRGGKSYTIELDCPDEYLTSMSGHVGYFHRLVVIKSLTFRSNRRVYGPFGSRGEMPFSFTSGIGKIVGFFGRSDRYLNSIAAHLELVHDNSPTPHTALLVEQGQGPVRTVETAS